MNPTSKPTLYLDTNVFLYAIDNKSKFYSSASSLLTLVENGTLVATTSIETFQEIIHLAKKQKKIKNGISICRLIYQLIPNPIPIDNTILKIFLQIVEKYTSLESRDCLHLAACLSTNVNILITEDLHLKKIKEKNLIIKSMDEMLNISPLAAQP